MLTCSEPSFLPLGFVQEIAGVERDASSFCQVPSLLLSERERTSATPATHTAGRKEAALLLKDFFKTVHCQLDEVSSKLGFKESRFQSTKVSRNPFSKNPFEMVINQFTESRADVAGVPIKLREVSREVAGGTSWIVKTVSNLSS